MIFSRGVAVLCIRRVALLVFLFAMASIGTWLVRDGLAAPATPATNQGQGNANPSDDQPIPASPEPKEYVGAGGGGSAQGFPIFPSGGPSCWPVPPTGSLTFSGGGEIILDGKPISQLAIGDGASKPEFEWKSSAPQVEPKPKNAPPPTAWSCSGAAQFQAGFSYSVSVGFSDTSASCGAATTVSRPASVTGPYLHWNDANQTSGTIYVPRIKTTTEEDAPFNPNKWRKTIGVGERVTCELEGAPSGAIVNWTVSNEGCEIDADAPNAYSAMFKAGDEETSVTVTAAFETENIQGTATATFSILAPTHETADKTPVAEIPPDQAPTVYPAGTQGASMHLTITLHPRTVSFYRVELKELSGPAKRITGYFQDLIASNIGYTAETFAHSAKTTWELVETDHTTSDIAEFGNYPAPWSAGLVEWEIPLRWRTLGKTVEHTLPDRIQIHEVLDAAGSSKESKFDESVSRTP